MKKTHETIDFLNKTLNGVNNVSIIAMDDQAFEKLLAWVYGVLLDYLKQRESNSESIAVLGLAHQVLDTIKNYHIEKNFPATQNTVFIFNNIVELLLDIVKKDFQVNEQIYDEAISTSKFLRAIRASEIALPGSYSYQTHHFRFKDGDSENLLNEEALLYASTHIKEYSKFVFDLACNSRYIPDPFALGQDSAQLKIYEKIKSLTTSDTPLPSEQPTHSA